jgi:membrane protease YdiL (CAAX protease family)
MGFAPTTRGLTWGAVIGALFFCVAINLGFATEITFDFLIDHTSRFLVICFLAPVIEEYVFRGMVMDAVGRRWSWRWPANVGVSISLANLIATLLFVCLHYLMRDPLTALLVAFPSLYLGILREQSGSLLICIGIHSFWNLCWVLFLQEVPALLY